MVNSNTLSFSLSHLYVDSFQRKSFEGPLILVSLWDQLQELVAPFVQLGGVELECRERRGVILIPDLVNGRLSSAQNMDSEHACKLKGYFV